mmetsp:Transcript_9323/g.26762  ORF Transcript_9323/g.26762 Transcript_9323/m.26762 type:complete len:315 (+) Transcript_9323:439-1383(+)
MFQVLYDWRSCVGICCPWRQRSFISGSQICVFAILSLAPSIAYHLSWDSIDNPEKWYVDKVGAIGPCPVTLAHLLGVTVYGVVSLLLFNVFAIRLSSIALNYQKRSRIRMFRLISTVLFFSQIMIRFVPVVFKTVVEDSTTNHCLNILYFIFVMLFTASAIWVLCLRPVLLDTSISCPQISLRPKLRSTNELGGLLDIKAGDAVGSSSANQKSNDDDPFLEHSQPHTQDFVLTMTDDVPSPEPVELYESAVEEIRCTDSPSCVAWPVSSGMLVRRNARKPPPLQQGPGPPRCGCLQFPRNSHPPISCGICSGQA